MLMRLGRRGGQDIVEGVELGVENDCCHPETGYSKGVEDRV